ncbi:MAG: hypothetical protein J6T38_10675 [Bacteroidaceae bacterium]|nr:hypothetical protein [Bacteroidaceae bacterium]
MYSEQLEELISLALEDGILTEQKKNLIIRRAAKEGEDVEEVMMVLETRLQKLNLERTIGKKTVVEKYIQPFEGLVANLEKNLRIQRENPRKIVMTLCNPDGCYLSDNMDIIGYVPFFEGETINDEPCSINVSCGLRIRISNCELDLFDGSDPLNSTHDEEPKLQLKVTFWDNDGCLESFRTLKCANMFREISHETTDGDILYQYFVDCGQNVNEMASVYTEILTKVYGLQSEDVSMDALWTGLFSTKLIDKEITDKEDLRAALKNYGLTHYKMPQINSKMLVREEIIDEMEEMINVYNEKYSKSTFIHYDLDKDKRYLIMTVLNGDMSTNKLKEIQRAFQVQKAEEYEIQMFNLGQLSWKEVCAVGAMDEKIEGKAYVADNDKEDEGQAINNDTEENLYQEEWHHDAEEDLQCDTDEVAMIQVPEEVLPQVMKIVKYYNERAIKWGYEVLEYDDESHTLSGSFKAKKDAEKSSSFGFWNKIKEAGKNADLQAEYQKILKLCGLD